MKVIATIAELRAALKADRLKGKSIGLVPTMGYLHIGHSDIGPPFEKRLRRHRRFDLREPDAVRTE